MMTSPVHILMTTDTVGGVWTYSIELATGLIEAGSRVSLATMGAPVSSSQRQHAEAAGICLYESDFELEWMDQPWMDVDNAGEWLIRLERRLRPDVVHLGGYSHGSLDWSAPVVIVAHSCVFSWWQAVHGTSAPEEWSYYRQRVSSGLQCGDAVVGVSGWMLRQLDRWYGVSGSCTIYNGLVPGRFKAGRKEEFVLTSGRAWDIAKNVRMLDRAAAKTLWPVFVAGSTAHPDGGECDLSHVRTLGVLEPDEMRELYARASIYALPALYEPFGLSVLEAALSECALILGDIPSLREIWGDETAIYVPPTDANAIASAIDRLIDSPEERKVLGRRAAKRASVFTRDRMVSAYLDIYRHASASYASRKDKVRCAS